MPDSATALAVRSTRPRPSEADEHALIRKYLPMARRVARRYAGRGEPLDDLTQVACLGLVKAAQRFSPERGNTFAAYALPTMEGEIKHHFRKMGWAMRVTRSVQENGLRVSVVLDELHQELGRSPTVEEVARRCGLGSEEVLEAMEASRAWEPMSLDTPRNAGDQVPSVGAADPGVEAAEWRAALNPALRKLPERERQALALRFGEGLSQSAIADRLGVSQMTVSRMLCQTLEHLRGELDEGL